MDTKDTQAFSRSTSNKGRRNSTVKKRLSVGKLKLLKDTNKVGFSTLTVQRSVDVTERKPKLTDLTIRTISPSSNNLKRQILIANKAKSSVKIRKVNIVDLSSTSAKKGKSHKIIIANSEAIKNAQSPSLYRHMTMSDKGPKQSSNRSPNGQSKQETRL